MTIFWKIFVGAGVAVTASAAIVFMSAVKVGAWSDDWLRRRDDRNDKGAERDRRNRDPRR